MIRQRLRLTLATTLLALLSVLASPSARAADGLDFVSMLPHFTVNLGDGSFLQMEAQTLVKNSETGEAVKSHMPALRHHIIMYLSDLFPEDLQTAKQREELREELTRLVRQTLKNMQMPDDVKGFYVTSLIMQ